MTTTLESLRTIFPRAAPGWLEENLDQMPHYGVDTPNEMATFLAQCGHESNGYTRFEENLNYSAERMMQVWSRKLFPSIEIAKEHEHNPEKLANYVYADENRSAKGKLGNTQPGDGWRYRGRGEIQATGRDLYQTLTGLMGVDLIAKPDLLTVPVYGVHSALIFYRDIAKVGGVLDQDEDQRLDTRRINGGETGLVHRQQLAGTILKNVFS